MHVYVLRVHVWRWVRQGGFTRDAGGLTTSGVVRVGAEVQRGIEDGKGCLDKWGRGRGLEVERRWACRG